MIRCFVFIVVALGFCNPNLISSTSSLVAKKRTEAGTYLLNLGTATMLACPYSTFSFILDDCEFKLTFIYQYDTLPYYILGAKKANFLVKYNQFKINLLNSAYTQTSTTLNWKTLLGYS
jgi:hypothetical protein